MELPILPQFNLALPQTGKALNSLHDHIEAQLGQAVEKTLTVDGNGAQNDNIFTITGAVEVSRLYAEVTVVTNATTVSTAYFDLWDGTAAIEITDNGGTDLSGVTVGDIIFKDAVATSPLTLSDNVAGAFTDGGGAGYYTTFCPFRVVKKTGATTTIRFNFTGDADTNLVIKFKVRYIPLSDDGAVTAS